MTDEHYRSLDGVEDARDVLRVGCQIAERVGWGNHRKTASLQLLDDAGPAGRVVPATVHKDHGGLGFVPASAGGRREWSCSKSEKQAQGFGPAIQRRVAAASWIRDITLFPLCVWVGWEGKNHARLCLPSFD